MLARNETLFKWTLYGAAALLCLLVQGLVLQRLTVWGVLPFLYPVAAVLPAIYEGPVSGTIYALAVGVVCDLLLPGAIPCFYTLVFPAAGLCAALISQSLLPAGVLCALVVSAVAFALTGGFHCLLLWLGGKAAWGAGALLAVREFAVTAALVIPAALLFRAVARKTRQDD